MEPTEEPHINTETNFQEVTVFCSKCLKLCSLISCKYGEHITDFKFTQDSYEVPPDEMNEDQLKQFLEKGIRFFEPRNPNWFVNTKSMLYTQDGYPEVTTECAMYMEKEL